MNFSFLSSEEMSLLEELWSYLEEKYLTPQYGNYENITINSDSLVSPAMIFISVFLATMTAGVIMIFNKRILGRLVRRLMSRGAVGYENAKTIDELELSSSIPIRLFINRYTLMRAVRCREEDDYYGIDPKDAPKLDSSIGLENTDRIKTPWWRKKKNGAQAKNDSEPCDTRDSEILSAEADTEKTAVIVDVTPECDAEISSPHQEDLDAASKKRDAEKDAGKPRFRTAYEASLLTKKKYRRSFQKDRFYVLEAETHRLRIRFDKKGTNPLALIFVAAFVIVGGLLVIRFLPWVLELFDGILGEFDRGY